MVCLAVPIPVGAAVNPKALRAVEYFAVKTASNRIPPVNRANHFEEWEVWERLVAVRAMISAALLG